MSRKGTKPLNKFSNPGRRVLCVDDAEPALALRALILENKGYTVTTSDNALQVAETFESGKFDLAVLDYEMPAMNGGQLAARLKTASPELKIILYTGASSVGRHDLRFIDAMVDKSEGVEELLAAIENFLPRWQNADSGVHGSAHWHETWRQGEVLGHTLLPYWQAIRSGHLSHERHCKQEKCRSHTRHQATMLTSGKLTFSSITTDCLLGAIPHQCLDYRDVLC